MGWRTLWATLAALLGLAIVMYWSYQPPAPLPLNSPAAEFSAQRAAIILQQVLGSETAHPVASAANAAVRERLLRHLQTLGIRTELQSGWVCDLEFTCAMVVNIIAQIPGSEPASSAVLLAAHYDSVPAGPGAGDDGAGVASILEIARILMLAPPPRRPVIVLLDEGEEAGLLGARLFVASHPAARTIQAAVNLDARGDSGPSLMFETGTATHWAMRLYRRNVLHPISNSLFHFVYQLLPNDTDFSVFKAAGFEGFNFAFIGGVQRYHTPLDRIDNLDLRSLQHQGENALATVRALAADQSQPQAAGAVFFDLFGRWLILWPTRWAAVSGGAITLGFVLAAWRLKRRVSVSARSMTDAFAALMCGWLGAITVAATLLAALRFSGAVPSARTYSWPAYPAGMHAACVALALLAPACAARLFSGRISAWGLWLANAYLVAALALFSSLLVPELSFLFVGPLLTLLLAVALAWRRLRRGAPANAVPPMVAVLPVLGTALVFMPSLLLIYSALGADAWPAITAAFGLTALGLAPLLHDTSAGSYRTYVWLAALTVVAGGGISALLPAYSAQMPQRILRWYVLDADSGQAHWLLMPDSKRVPPALAYRAAATLPPQPRAAAPAAGVDYPAPQLQVLGIEQRSGGTVYRLHLQSVRAAPELELAVPPGQIVRAAFVLSGERRVPAQFWRAPDGARWLKLIGTPDAGVDLELQIDGGDTIELLDRSYGLPATSDGPPARSAAMTASQDGDLTIVYRTIRLGDLKGAPDS